jgi:hypothetical protein
VAPAGGYTTLHAEVCLIRLDFKVDVELVLLNPNVDGKLFCQRIAYFFGVDFDLKQPVRLLKGPNPF